MAKIILGTHIGALLREDADVDISEYAVEDGEYVAKAGGKIVGHLRRLPDHMGTYWELEIPTWEYPGQNLMLTIKQR